MSENIVVFKGAENSFIGTYLTNVKFYQYWVFTFSHDGVYSDGVVAEGIPEN